MYVLYKCRGASQTTTIYNLCDSIQPISIKDKNNVLFNEDKLLLIEPSNSNSEELTENLRKRRKITDTLSESSIIRDLLFVLQGIDGEFIKYSQVDDKYKIQTKDFVNRPTSILISRISELGWILRNIKAYLTEASSLDIGLIEQSFRDAVSEEIKNYYKMLAILETQMSEKISNNGGLTLRRLAVWAAEPMHRLKWISFMIEVVRNSKTTTSNNHVLQLSSFKMHGNQTIQSLLRGIEDKTSKPLMNMIKNWIFNGQLNDPFGEFFIKKNPLIEQKHRIVDVGVSSRPDVTYWEWENQYILIDELIPSFISRNYASLILVIGKSMIFLKQIYDDMDWILETSKTFYQKMNIEEINLFDELIPVLEKLKDIVHKRVLFYVLDKHNILQHCETIKRYVFLSQGDFINSFIDNAYKELDAPPSNVYKQYLETILDATMKFSSFSSYPSEIQERLLIKLKEHDSIHKIGWDIVEFDYRTDNTINVLIGTPTFKSYQSKIFNFMWKLKRTSFIIRNLWSVLNGASKFSKNAPESISTLHQGFLAIKSMLDFINKIESFIIFHVIENEWNKFHNQCKTVSNLDELIILHSNYINSILEVLFLEKNGDKNVTFIPIDDIHSIVVEYQKYCKELYEGLKLTIKRRSYQMKRDNWGITDEDIELDIKFKEYLSKVEGILEKLSNDHQEVVKKFDNLYKERFQASFVEGIF